MGSAFKPALLFLCMVLLAPAPEVRSADPELTAVEHETIQRSMLHYPAFREVALSIMHSCPPSLCYYVGIGRSPTGIIAFLQGLAPNGASNLPFSIPVTEQGRKVNFTESEKAEIFKHFDEYFPDAAEIGGKRIALIDFTISGKSLFNAAALLQEYFKKRGRNEKLELHPYGADKELSLNKTGLPMELHLIDKRDPFAEEAFSQVYDRVAEYPKYKAGTPKQKLTEKMAYKILRGRIRMKIQADSSPSMAEIRNIVAGNPVAIPKAEVAVPLPTHGCLRQILFRRIRLSGI